eukprot:s2725_g7.t1
MSHDAALSIAKLGVVQRRELPPPNECMLKLTNILAFRYDCCLVTSRPPVKSFKSFGIAEEFAEEFAEELCQATGSNAVVQEFQQCVCEVMTSVYGPWQAYFLSNFRFCSYQEVKICLASMSAFCSSWVRRDFHVTHVQLSYRKYPTQGCLASSVLSLMRTPVSGLVQDVHPRAVVPVDASKAGLEAPVCMA